VEHSSFDTHRRAITSIDLIAYATSAPVYLRVAQSNR
jgi:hypothetical protein